MLDKARAILTLRKKHDFIVLTSKKPVKILSENGLLSFLENNIVFSIGSQTRSVLKKHGIESRIPESANAGRLADLILETSGMQEGLFICGEQHLDKLPDKLKKEGIILNKLIVYRTELQQPDLNTNGYDGYYFLSPSAVHSFFSRYDIGESVPAFCIGKTTQKALISYKKYSPVIVSEKQSLPGMLEATRKFFNNGSN